MKIPLRKSLYGPTIHGQDIAVEKDMGEEREKCVGKHAIWECRNHGKHNPFTSIHHMRTLDPGLIGTAYFFYFLFFTFLKLFCLNKIVRNSKIGYQRGNGSSQGTDFATIFCNNMENMV